MNITQITLIVETHLVERVGVVEEPVQRWRFWSPFCFLYQTAIARCDGGFFMHLRIVDKNEHHTYN